MPVTIERKGDPRTSLERLRQEKQCSEHTWTMVVSWRELAVKKKKRGYGRALFGFVT